MSQHDGGGKMKGKGKKSSKPYSREDGRKSLVGQFSENVLSMVTPSWLGDLLSSAKKTKPKANAASSIPSETVDDGWDKMISEDEDEPKVVTDGIPYKLFGSPNTEPTYSDSSTIPVSISSLPSGPSHLPVASSSLSVTTGSNMSVVSMLTPFNTEAADPQLVYFSQKPVVQTNTYNASLPHTGVAREITLPSVERGIPQPSIGSVQRVRQPSTDSRNAEFGLARLSSDFTRENASFGLSQTATGMEHAEPQQSALSPAFSFLSEKLSPGSETSNQSALGHRLSQSLYYPGRSRFGGRWSANQSQLNGSSPYSVNRTRVRPVSNTAVPNSTTQKILRVLESTENKSRPPVESFTPASYMRKKTSTTATPSVGRLLSRTNTRGPPVRSQDMMQPAETTKCTLFKSTNVPPKPADIPSKPATSAPMFPAASSDPVRQVGDSSRGGGGGGKMKSAPLTRKHGRGVAEQSEDTSEPDVPLLNTDYTLQLKNTPKLDFGFTVKTAATSESQTASRVKPSVVSPLLQSQQKPMAAPTSKSAVPIYFSQPVPASVVSASTDISSAFTFSSPIHLSSKTSSEIPSPLAQTFSFQSPLKVASPTNADSEGSEADKDNSEKSVINSASPVSSVTTTPFGAVIPSTKPFGSVTASSAVKPFSSPVSNSTKTFGVIPTTTTNPFGSPASAVAPFASSISPETNPEASSSPAASASIVKPFGAPATTLSSGSVMDILKKSSGVSAEPQSKGFAPAAKLSAGSVMSVLGKGSSDDPKPFVGFKPKNDSKWSCSTCLVENESTQQTCVCCMSAKPTSKPAAANGGPTAVAVPAVKFTSSPAVGSTGGDWSCEICLVSNKASADKCVCCMTAKPASNTKSATTAPAAITATIKPTPMSAALAPATGSWTCDTCLISNKPDASSCIACATPKPGAKPTGLPVAKPLSSASGKPVSSSAGPWTCDTCLVVNQHDDSACIACSTPKPGAAAKPSKPAEKSTIKFGGAFPSTTPSSGVKFGSSGGPVDFGKIDRPVSFGPVKFGGRFDSTKTDNKPQCGSSSPVKFGASEGSTSLKASSDIVNCNGPSTASTDNSNKLATTGYGVTPASRSESKPATNAFSLTSNFGATKPDTVMFAAPVEKAPKLFDLTSNSPKLSTAVTSSIFGTLQNTPAFSSIVKPSSGASEELMSGSTDKPSTASKPIFGSSDKPSFGNANKQIFGNSNSAVFGVDTTAANKSSASSDSKPNSFVFDQSKSTQLNSSDASKGYVFGAPKPVDRGFTFGAPKPVDGGFAFGKTNGTDNTDGVLSNTTNTQFTFTAGSSAPAAPIAGSNLTNIPAAGSAAVPNMFSMGSSGGSKSQPEGRKLKRAHRRLR